MSEEIQLTDLELAALVSSRICHDIISPVGAIANGIEILDEENEQEMRDHAMDLVRKSATQASAKLQFARLAFGAAGSAGATIDLNEAQRVARGVAESDKHVVEWDGPAAAIAKDKVKLLLNMITLALAALPRGGSIKVSIQGETETPAFKIRCDGDSSRVPEILSQILNGELDHALDAHSIQPFYTKRIATAAGMTLDAGKDGESIVLSATCR